MSALFRCVPALALTALGASLLASPAEAAECTYTDLHGTFEVRVDCEGLKDHSNLGNEQKRMWLAGTWGQMNIIEVPPPYKQDAGKLDLIMSECDADGDGGVSYEEFVDKLARETVAPAAMGKRGMQSKEAMGVDSQEMLAEQLGHKNFKEKFNPTVNG